MDYKKLLIVIFVIYMLLFLSGCTTNDTNNGSNNVDWLMNYSPVHSLGTEKDDFWVEYPNGHPNASQSVSHLSWINDSLEEGCMLFVVHKTGCVACQPQADRVINLAEKYREHVIFHDLDIALGGSVEQRAYDSYLYDPDGPPGYIALTGVLTLIKNNGDVEFGWHSWEKDVDDAEMEEWVKDGIYYWNENSGGIK
ncbi:MAG: hypothetical protein JSW60_03250 [Thermoplasmatales archaeon]|nr:MAG: hypothetical protein JSW60_03250 [Thermoplasmatales archaeon]